MRAAVLSGINERIIISDIPSPGLLPNWAEIDIRYAALNHRDLWIKKGKYAGITYPIVVGSDLCGKYKGQEIIVNPGYNWGAFDSFHDKSFSILGLPRNGSLAEKTQIPVENIFPKPVHLSASEAAALPLAGVTAFRALITKCKPVKREKIFITGIGGGVALMAMQFALALELDVYVSSSDDLKIQQAIQLGAKGGVNYKNPGWENDLLALSGPIQICLDSAGGNDFSKLIKIADSGGRIAIYGGTAGPISAINPQQVFWKQLNIFGSTMGTNAEFLQMLGLVNAYSIHPIVDRIFPLTEINEAFDYMESQKQFGKIVIDITH